MLKKRSKHPENGFTLLELLLSMVITAVIVVMIFGTFRIGIRAWEKGERDVETQQRLMAVTDLLKSQLRSITVSSSPIIAKGDRLVWFDGSEQQLRFTSILAIDPKNGRLPVFVKLEVDSDEKGDSLYLWEVPIISTRNPIDEMSTDPKTRHEILSGMRSITFEYLTTIEGEEGTQWETEWSSSGDTYFPMAVRIRIIEMVEGMPIQTIVPLYASKVI